MESSITRSSPKKRKELKKEFIKRHSVLVNKAVDEGRGSDAAKEMIKLIKSEIDHLRYSQNHGIYANISMLCMNMRINDEIEYTKPVIDHGIIIEIKPAPKIEPMEEKPAEIGFKVIAIDEVKKIKEEQKDDDPISNILKEIEENKKKPYKFS